MTHNVSTIFSILVIFVIIISQTEAEIKKNDKDISSFLTKYEITTITEADYRTSRRKYTERDAEKSFQIKAFGNTFIIDLSIFYPRQDAEIKYISYHKNNTGSFYNSKFLIHQGYVRNVKNSLVLGYFAKGYPFRGYVVTDEVFCIEPYESDKVIVYRFTDVITPGCVKGSEDEDLDCSGTRYFVPLSGNRVPIKESFLFDYNMFYNKYIDFYHRIKPQKAELEKRDGEKNNTSINRHSKNEHKTHRKNKYKHNENKPKTHNRNGVDNWLKVKEQNHHKCDEKGKNRTDTNKNDDINARSSCKNKTDYFEITNPQDLSDKRKFKKSESKTKDEDKEEKEGEDDDDDDDYDNYNDDDDDNDNNDNNEIPNDEDRFSVSNESLSKDIETYQKQLIQKERRATNIKPLAEALISNPTESLQCDVEVVVAPSLLQKFGNNVEMIIKDVLIQFTLLNKILFKVFFRKGDKMIHFTVRVKGIVLHGDEVYSPFTKRADLEYFAKTNQPLQDFCLSIGLVNQYLKSGDLFDGYTSEGKGGICSKNGNVILASHGNENTPAPMALYFANIIRGITRAMGAIDKDEKCAGGAYPNPMQILKNYLLAERIELNPEYSIFTSCNVKEIESVLEVRACLERVSQPLCGNAVLDPGEECDCGPISKCSKIDACCNPPHLLLDPEHKSCTLLPSSRCSALQDCCEDCEISTYENVCYSGSGQCDLAMCNGLSALCPTGAESSNGMICSDNESFPEPLVCKDSKCDQLLCSSFDLEPCTCAFGGEKECHYCCVKDGKCQTADKELKLFPDRNYYLPDDTECSLGYCLEGICKELDGLRHSLKKRPRFHITSDGHIKFNTLYVIINSALSFLILCILKFRF